MSTRDRWLDEGIAVLRESGPESLRVDRLARRLGLTKGSFHHHFDGVPGYRGALLAHCRGRTEYAIADARVRLREFEGADVITALPALAAGLHDRGLDVALRSWAIADDDARATVEAIDGMRLAFLEELWSGVLDDPADARVAALVPHLVTVGASGSPGVRDDELGAVFALLARLVPGLSRA